MGIGMVTSMLGSTLLTRSMALVFIILLTATAMKDRGTKARSKVSECTLFEVEIRDVETGMLEF